MSAWGRWRYRLHQFRLHLAPPALTPADHAQVAGWLPPPLFALFERMTAGEQAHSLAVARLLAAQGHTARPLLQAALLHDVGKSVAPLSLMARVIIVLGHLLPRATRARWGAGAPRGWRKPFVVAAQHPAWGADLAERAGAEPVVVTLIRQHQAPIADTSAPEVQWLRLLQSADDES
jgi:hypothetical protein